jgi:hypothetical protein
MDQYFQAPASTDDSIANQQQSNPVCWPYNPSTPNSTINQHATTMPAKHRATRLGRAPDNPRLSHRYAENGASASASDSGEATRPGGGWLHSPLDEWGKPEAGFQFHPSFTGTPFRWRRVLADGWHAAARWRAPRGRRSPRRRAVQPCAGVAPPSARNSTLRVCRYFVPELEGLKALVAGASRPRSLASLENSTRRCLPLSAPAGRPDSRSTSRLSTASTRSLARAWQACWAACSRNPR